MLFKPAVMEYMVSLRMYTLGDKCVQMSCIETASVKDSPYVTLTTTHQKSKVYVYLNVSSVAFRLFFVLLYLMKSSGVDTEHNKHDL